MIQLKRVVTYVNGNKVNMTRQHFIEWVQESVDIKVVSDLIETLHELPDDEEGVLKKFLNQQKYDKPISSASKFECTSSLHSSTTGSREENSGKRSDK